MVLTQLVDTHDEPVNYFLSSNWTGKSGATEAAAGDRAGTSGTAAESGRGRRREGAVDPSQPTVFAGKPSSRYLCPVCHDVMELPTVCEDGVTYCRACVPLGAAGGGKSADLALDESLLNMTRQLPIVCRNALTRRRRGDGGSGNATWVYDYAGCQKTLTIAGRAAHEAECSFALEQCNLPFADSPMDNCPLVLPRVTLEQHRKVCPHRLVECQHKGCGRRVQARKLADHENVCWHKPMTCPNPPCLWRGTRRELSSHLDVCPEAEVVCGMEDTENPTQSCKHTCRRRMLDFHRPQCELRHVPCSFCQTPVSYAHLQEHEEACEYRKVLCGQCGQMVPVQRYGEHVRFFCAAGTRTCEFKDYGCSERCAPGELASHMIENAHAHLRLVMLQLERVKGDTDSWSAEVADVRAAVVASVQRSAEELDGVREAVAQMREEGERETVDLRTRVDALQRLYDDMATTVRRRLAEVDEEVTQRAHLIVNENRLLREALAKCLTREELQAALRDVESGRALAAEEVAEVRRNVERHSLQWEADAAKLTELATDSAAQSRAEAEALREQCVDFAVGNKEKWGHLWATVREVGRAFATEATATHARGAALEERVSALNENHNPHLVRSQVELAAMGGEHTFSRKPGAARGDAADSARGRGGADRCDFLRALARPRARARAPTRPREGLSACTQEGAQLTRAPQRPASRDQRHGGLDRQPSQSGAGRRAEGGRWRRPEEQALSRPAVGGGAQTRVGVTSRA